MRKIPMYKTVDGRSFENRDEAKAHEAELMARQAMEQEAAPIIAAQGSAVRLINLMLGDPAPWLAILRKHAQAKAKFQPEKPAEQEEPVRLRMTA